MTTQQRAIIIKYKDPADEIIGTAKNIAAILRNRNTRHATVAIYTPNNNWTVQITRALQVVKVKAAATFNTDVDIQVIIRNFEDFSDNFADYVFILGMNDGFYTNSGQDASERSDKYEQIEAIALSSRTLTVFSYLSQAERSFADAANLAYARVKEIDGKPHALVLPSPFFMELGALRPATLGPDAAIQAILPDKG